jgi:hypothetical protein
MDDDDVRMVERRGRLGLLDESLSSVGVGRLPGGKDLNGHEAVEMRVLSFVDGAHAALADLFQDAIMEERLADHGLTPGVIALVDLKILIVRRPARSQDAA